MESKFDRFMKYQIEKQIENPAPAPYKKSLDFGPFDEAMSAMNRKRYVQIESLVLEKPIAKIREALESESLSCEELTVFYLKRIRDLDPGKLNAVITLNPDALILARECDRYKGDETRLLNGIPILVKDNIATGDQMPNTAGCAVMKDTVPDRAAPVVDVLKDSGAVVLGKANLSEWAFYMSTEGVCGYSALGGQCRNPYGPYGVGGSSSGSAVAVSANLCVAAIGTETSGSIINPSGQSGVAGLYPTRGSWPSEGIIPISNSLDTPGPICRSVEDLTLLHETVTGQPCNRDLENEQVVIGLIDNEQMMDSRRSGDMQILQRIAGELRQLGFIVESVLLEEGAFDVDMGPVLEYEFNSSVERHFSEWGAPVRNLSGIVKRYQEAPDFAPYGYDLLEASIHSSITEEKHQRRLKGNAAVCQAALDQAFKTCDFLLSISSQLSGIYASAGYPSLTVPAGLRDSGEPVGLTLTAPREQEGRLMAVAERYERATRYRKNPL